MNPPSISPLEAEHSPEPDMHWDLDKIAGGGIAVLAASVFGNGLSYVFGIFLARILGADQFGLYALGLTLFNTLSLMAVLGMDTAGIKFITQYLGLGQENNARATIVQVTSIVIVFALFLALCLAALAIPLSTSIYEKPVLTAVLWLFAAALPLAAISSLFVSILQALQTVRYVIIVKYFWEPISKFTLAALFLWIGFGLFGVIIAIILTFAGSAAITLKALRHRSRITFKTLPCWPTENFKHLLIFSAPLAFSNLISVIAPRSDILLLGHWVSAQQVGIYLAAFQTASMLALVLGAFEMALVPLMGKLLSEGEWGRVEQIYKNTSRLVFMLTIPIFIVLVIFCKELLSFFGEQFVSGTISLIILSTGQVISSGSGSPNNLLLMGGQSRLVLWNTIALGLVLVTVTVILIPIWGIVGAAVAIASVQVVSNVIRILQVWKLYHIHPYAWSLAKPASAGACSAAVMIGFKSSVEPHYYPLIVGLGMVIYLASLSGLRFTDSDRALLKTLLNKLIYRQD